MRICILIYTYIHVHVCICMYMYICIRIEIEVQFCTKMCTQYLHIEVSTSQYYAYFCHILAQSVHSTAICILCYANIA